MSDHGVKLSCACHNQFDNASPRYGSIDISLPTMCQDAVSQVMTVTLVLRERDTASFDHASGLPAWSLLTKKWMNCFVGFILLPVVMSRLFAVILPCFSHQSR